LMVCEASEKTDLKNLRIASKETAKIAAVPLFRELTIPTDRITTDYAHRTAFNHGYQVRTLRVTTIYYFPYSFEEFTAPRAGLPRLPAVCCDRPHQLQAYNQYIQLRHKHIMSFGHESFVRLRDLLKSMTTLQKVLVTDGVYEVDPDNYFCSLLNCNRHDEWDHTRLTSRPVSGLQMLGVRYLGYLLKALQEAKIPVRELAVSGTGNMIVGSLQDTAFWLQTPYSVDFSILTKLHLEIHSGVWINFRDQVPPHVTTSVSQTLALAVNLRCLSLATPPIFPAMSLKALLGGCEFSQLRSCILLNLKSTYEDICNFTKHTGDLEHLCLHVFDLTTGTWELALEALKNNLPHLQDVYFDRLYGRFGLQVKNVYLFHNYADRYAVEAGLDQDAGYQDDAALIEAYLLADGKNPFCPKTLELTIAKVLCSQRREGMGVLDRCRKYPGVPLNPLVATQTGRSPGA
ncbi:MAG: hypothetical protein L6R42_006004, partial [Xanthoria sp. 1 TBL-2021]